MNKLIFSSRVVKINYFILILFSIITGIFLMLIPIFEGNLIDSLVYKNNVEKFYFWCILLFILGFTQIGLSYLITNIKIVKKQKLRIFLNKYFMKYILEKDIKHILKFDLVYLNHRVDNDIEKILSFFSDTLISIMINILNIVFIIIYLFFVDSYIVIYLLIFIPIYIFLYYKFEKKIYKSSYNLIENENIYLSTKNSIYENIKDIKIAENIFNNLKYLSKKENKLTNETRINFNLHYSLSSIKIFISLVFQIIFFITSGLLVLNGQMTIGKFVVILQFFSTLLLSIDGLFSVVSSYQEYLVSNNRIEEIINIPDDLNGTLIVTHIDCIQLIDFNYLLDNDTTLYSKDINIEFKKDNVYTIIGKNGVGKSTLLYSLLGIYKSNCLGYIKYNSIDFKELNFNEIRMNKISFLPQVKNFSDLTVENFLNLYTCTTKINDLLEIPEFNNFFCNKLFNIKLKYNTKIEKLSTGEQKMVQLFCCFSKLNSEVFILDEPTANLNETMLIDFINLLDYVSHNKITIIVTHNTVLSQNYNSIELF